MTDIQIAQAAQKENIVEIAKRLGLTEDDIEQYGKYKAKINLDVLQKNKRPNGKLILGAPCATGRAAAHDPRG